MKSQAWNSLPSFPGVARDDACGFRIGNSIYLGTGLSPWFSEQEDFWLFDLANGQWQAVAPLPSGEGRQYAASFQKDGKGYVFGGVRASKYLNDLWVYEPLLDQWSALSPLPDSGRSGAATFVLGDTAYVLGGKSQDKAAISELWAYAIGQDRWFKKSKLPKALWRSSAAASDSVGYMIFGIDSLGQYSNYLFQYDPTLDLWQRIDSFPQLGRSHTFLLYDQASLWLVMGIDSLGDYKNDLWEYDLASGNWQARASLPAPGRKGGVAFKGLNASLIYCTGIDVQGHRLKETWQFQMPVGLQEEAKRTKELIGTYDLLGREIPFNSSGIKVNSYSDGSFEKVYQQAP